MIDFIRIDENFEEQIDETHINKILKYHDIHYSRIINIEVHRNDSELGKLYNYALIWYAR